MFEFPNKVLCVAKSEEGLREALRSICTFYLLPSNYSFDEKIYTTPRPWVREWVTPKEGKVVHGVILKDEYNDILRFSGMTWDDMSMGDLISLNKKSIYYLVTRIRGLGRNTGAHLYTQIFKDWAGIK